MSHCKEEAEENSLNMLHLCMVCNYILRIGHNCSIVAKYLHNIVLNQLFQVDLEVMTEVFRQ